MKVTVTDFKMKSAALFTHAYETLDGTQLWIKHIKQGHLHFCMQEQVLHSPMDSGDSATRSPHLAPQTMAELTHIILSNAALALKCTA
jgi:hypothetical protein